MKYSRYLLFTIIFAFAFSFSSCENEDGGYFGSSSSGTSEGRCSISPTTKKIDGGSGSFTITVKSNTNWSASLNNSGSEGITGMRLSTYSGNGNGKITVSYDAVSSQYYQQQGVVIVSYNGYGGYEQTLTCSVHRKRLPNK